jgi:hypothetical protein
MLYLCRQIRNNGNKSLFLFIISICFNDTYIWYGNLKRLLLFLKEGKSCKMCKFYLFKFLYFHSLSYRTQGTYMQSSILVTDVDGYKLSDQILIFAVVKFFSVSLWWDWHLGVSVQSPIQCTPGVYILKVINAVGVCNCPLHVVLYRVKNVWSFYFQSLLVPSWHDT